MLCAARASVARGLPLALLAAALILAAHAATAQEISIDLGDGQSFSLRTVQLFLLITLVSVLAIGRVEKHLNRGHR